MCLCAKIKNEKTMEQPNNKTSIRQLVDDLKGVLPVGYLVAIAIGMLFNYFKFSHFNINIFQYASVFDFLISPFEDFNILIFMMLSISIPLLALWTDRIWKKYYPASYKKASFGISDKKWYKQAEKPFYGFLIILYIFIASQEYGKHTQEAVYRQSDITIRLHNNERISGKQIGKVGNILFLLTNDSVKVFPIDGMLKEISWPHVTND